MVVELINYDYTSFGKLREDVFHLSPPFAAAHTIELANCGNVCEAFELIFVVCVQARHVS